MMMMINSVLIQRICILSWSISRLGLQKIVLLLKLITMLLFSLKFVHPELKTTRRLIGLKYCSGKPNKTNRWSRRGGREACFRSCRPRINCLSPYYPCLPVWSCLAIYCISSSRLLGKFFRVDQNYFFPQPSLFLSSLFSSQPDTVSLNKTRCGSGKFSVLGNVFQRRVNL